MLLLSLFTECTCNGVVSLLMQRILQKKTMVGKGVTTSTRRGGSNGVLLPRARTSEVLKVVQILQQRLQWFRSDICGEKASSQMWILALVSHARQSHAAARPTYAKWWAVGQMRLRYYLHAANRIPPHIYPPSGTIVGTTAVTPEGTSIAACTDVGITLAICANGASYLR